MYIYLLVVVLLVLVYYLWNQSNNLKVYYFMKPECKYCNEMADEWKTVENKLSGSGITCKRIDITEPRYKKIKDNFNFKTVPHIVKINNNGIRDVFDGNRKSDEIITWIYENYEI
jgi:hypothetical protein